MAKKRLDHLMVDRQLVHSRSKAQSLIMAGQVRVDGQIALKSGEQFSEEIKIEIILHPIFVSRGGDKLAAAINAFNIDVRGRICADVGSSTGGFCDCLLQSGAKRVYAIDVGKGILHWKLRNDPRVVVMEATNARFVERLPESVNLITIDVSFISLKTLLPVLRNWFLNNNLIPDNLTSSDIPLNSTALKNYMIALIKPQFEAGRKAVSRGKGVISDPKLHGQVLNDVLSFAQEIKYGVIDIIQSPLKGPKGNIEFFSLFEYPCQREIDIADLVESLKLNPLLPE